MNKRQQILTLAAATTLLTIGGPAAASDDGKLAYDSEINSCVTEVGKHANYSDATRVRHTVIRIKHRPGIGPRTGIGYVFTIDTSVFTDSDEIAVRKYASYCVARGEDAPVKFTIDQVSG